MGSQCQRQQLNPLHYNVSPAVAWHAHSPPSSAWLKAWPLLLSQLAACVLLGGNGRLEGDVHPSTQGPDNQVEDLAGSSRLLVNLINSLLEIQTQRVPKNFHLELSEEPTIPV